MPASCRTGVWLVGRRSPAMQRRCRFVAGSGAHPARMWPDLAARAIAEYSGPGDLVADPLCGIGTALVEAIRVGRDAVGVEYEPRWAELARANLALARAQDGTGHGIVECADATTLHRDLPGVLAVLAGRVDLVVTSPPYGRTMHGRVEHRRGSLRRFARSYGPEDPANLAHRGRVGLIEGITSVLAGCGRLLRPGGISVVTARSWRRDRFPVDRPGHALTAGIAAGLQPVDRGLAPPAGHRDCGFIPQHSFFQLTVARQSRRKGRPAQQVAPEDLLAFEQLFVAGTPAALSLRAGGDMR